MKFLQTVTKSLSTVVYENPNMLSNYLLDTSDEVQIKRYTHVRLSEINHICPREYAIGYFLGLEKQSVINFAEMRQMELGSALHFWYQNYSKVFRNVLVGYWYCLACEKVRKHFGFKPNTRCEHCGASPKATVYHEYMFRMDNPYRVVGKVDLILYKDGVYRFGELKTLVEAPQEPKPEHIAQISAYAYFYNFVPKDQKLPIEIDTSVVYLCYVPKKFSYRNPLLTFPIKPSGKGIDLLIERVKQFSESVKTRTLPAPLEECIREGFMKRRCYVAKVCKKFYEDGKTQI